MTFDVDFEEVTNEFNAEFESTVAVAGGLTEDVKQALLELFQHLAYTDADGQEYYDALYDAFYPPRELSNIIAVYTQSGTVYPDTPLDDLKTDLVVTARYSDGTTEEVTDYTLSGTLTAGRSTITVSYGGKTTTFNVTVTAAPVLSSITAVYTQSGTVYDTDSLDSLKTDLVVTAVYSDSSTAVVPSTDYTLSGTLTVGTSTITVSYQSKTTTFNVTVVACLYPLLNGEYTTSNGEYKFTITNGHHIKVEVLGNYTGTSAHFTMLNGYTGDMSISTSDSINNKETLFTIPVNKLVTLKMENVVNSSNGGAELCMTIALLRNANTTTSFLATTEAEHTTDQTVTITPVADSPIGAFGFGINGQKYKQGAYFECDIVVTVGDDIYIGGAA